MRNPKSFSSYGFTYETYLDHKRHNRILKDANGYEIFKVKFPHIDNNEYDLYVDELLANQYYFAQKEELQRKYPDKELYVKHLDGDISNNEISNLAWAVVDTPTQDAKDNTSTIDNSQDSKLSAIDITNPTNIKPAISTKNRLSDFFLFRLFTQTFDKIPESDKPVTHFFFMAYIFSSLVSFFHLLDFLQISNSLLYSIILALFYEFGNVALIIGILNSQKLSSTSLLLSMLIIITTLITLGNVYSNFVHIDNQSYSKLIQLLDMEDTLVSRRIVAIIQGSPYPILGAMFVKSILNFIENKSN